MSKFYVGQRVRIVAAKHVKHLIGREATIVARGEIGSGERWRLDIDNEIPPASAHGFHRWQHWASDQLAPAYDGNEKVSWESCLWQPSPERVA